MVKFGNYWETMVARKPDWRKVFIDYPELNAVIGEMKRVMKAFRAQLKERNEDEADAQRDVMVLDNNTQGGDPSSPSASLRGATSTFAAEDTLEDVFILKAGLKKKDKKKKEKKDDDDDDQGNSRRERTPLLVSPRGVVSDRTLKNTLQKGGAGGGSSTADLTTARMTPPPAAAAGDMNNDESPPPRPVVGAVPKNRGAAEGETRKAKTDEEEAPQQQQQQGRRVTIDPSRPKEFNEEQPKQPQQHHDRIRSLTADELAERGLKIHDDIGAIASPSDKEAEDVASGFPDAATLRASFAMKDGPGSLTAGATSDGFGPSSSLANDEDGGIDQVPSLRSSQAPGSVRGRSRSTFGPESVQVRHGTAVCHEGLEFALEFELLIQSETNKCARFLHQSLVNLQRFYEANADRWASPGFNMKRAKESMSFLYQEITHLVMFAETNELSIKTAMKKFRNHKPKGHPYGGLEDEEILLEAISEELDRVVILRRSVEMLFSELFHEGDITHGVDRIRGKKKSATQAFRAGVGLALCFSVVLYWIHIFLEIKLDAHGQREWERLFPVMRLFTALLWFIICWSWVLFVFEYRRINYLFVFQFSTFNSVQFLQALEYGLWMMFLCLLSGALFLRSMLSHEGYASAFPAASPYFIPSFIFIFVLSIAFPIRHVLWRTRNSFFKTFAHCLILPFGHVMFVEFFVADWGTSMVYTCGDLLYLACYFIAWPRARVANVNDTYNECQVMRDKWYFPISMIPYYWRACQTLKMYLRTDNKAHLVNHGKYWSCLITFVAMWAQALFFKESVVMAAIVWIVHIGSQLYCFVWDVLMDWGFIQGRKRKMMFPDRRVYMIATVFDFFARMFWIPAAIWIQPQIGENWMYTIQANLEIFRRSMWSIFRVENENVNNLETYRRIDFVPEVALPEDEDAKHAEEKLKKEQ